MQLVLFYFDFSCQYLYQLLINYLCRVLFLSLLIISEAKHKNIPITLLGVVILYILLRHWVIIWNSGTPFQNVSYIYCNSYYYDLIHLTNFYTYYFPLGFHDQIYFQHKIDKQNRRGTIWHTRCEHWTRKQFKGQADCWKKDLFSVGNQPVLLWLSLSVTVTNHSCCDN